MTPELQDRLIAALERPHRLGMIGGDLEEQLAHCASFSRVLAQIDGIETFQSAVDLGTGGGLPGVALAASFPHLMWTLVEIRTSRAMEVERALARISVAAEVRTEPAQDLGHDPSRRETADLAVARSFGPPSMTAECAAGMVRVGGRLVVSEPPSDPGGTRWPTAPLDELGWAAPHTVFDDDHHFAVFEKVAPTPERLPRRNNKALQRWSN